MLSLVLLLQAGPAPLVLVDPRGDTVSPPTPAQRAIFETLRLSLGGMTFPEDRYYGSGCSDYGENAGSATGLSPFPTQRAIGLRLLPSLTLAGFSRAGCPISSHVGAGLVFVQPITRTIALSASAGYIMLPHAGPGGSAVKHEQVRGDIVFTRPNGRAFTVGVGTGPTPFTFGGLW